MNAKERHPAEQLEQLLQAHQAPQALLGMANIMRRAFEGDCLTALAEELAQRIAHDPLDMSAVMDLVTVLQIRGQCELAMQLQRHALAVEQHYTLAENPIVPTLNVLAIMAPGETMANTPIDFLVENSTMALDFLYLGEGLPAPETIPAHDVAFVCVCQSDENDWLLHQLDDVMQHWPRPFINRPARIAALSRESVRELLSNVEGIRVSQTYRLSRSDVEQLATLQPDWLPAIVRPVNSHAGHDLEKVDTSAQLLRYVRQSPTSQREFYVAPFIDYSSHDGKYRKARIVVVDGEPLVAHMAVSARWMVHYLNADMLDHPEHRQEEAAFMRTFDTDFRSRHARALEAIDRKLQLDYYSIDCAETQDGDLVVFEIDSGAVVHSMDPVDIFPYKRPQMERVFSAVQSMLMRRAQHVSRQVA